MSYKHFLSIVAFCLLIILLSSIYLSCQKAVMDEKEAQKVLNEFYTNTEPEPLLNRPLVRAGKAIVPYLIIEIQKKDMPLRGYAILALGEIGDKRALPVLIKILEDNSEHEITRGDALRAIWHIDKKLGKKMAKKHSGENKEIDEVFQLLKEGKIDN